MSKRQKAWDWASRGTPSENEDWDIFFGAEPYGVAVEVRGRAYTITTAGPGESVYLAADQEFGE